MESENSIIVEAQSVAYLKLMKTEVAKTGKIKYNWEIKQLSLDITALEKINNEMLNKFGSSDDTI